MENTGSENGDFMTHAFIQYLAVESCINFYQLQIFISSEHIYMTKLRQKRKVRQYYLDKWHLVMLNDPTLSPKFNFLILTRLFREMPVRVTKPNGSNFHEAKHYSTTDKLGSLLGTVHQQPALRTTAGSLRRAPPKLTLPMLAQHGLL